jgi:hypothetical protein
MGCGCGSGTKAAVNAAVQTYQIKDDPESVEYLTERDALDNRAARGLTGEVVPTP